MYTNLSLLLTASSILYGCASPQPTAHKSDDKSSSLNLSQTGHGPARTGIANSKSTKSALVDSGVITPVAPQDRESVNVSPIGDEPVTKKSQPKDRSPMEISESPESSPRDGASVNPYGTATPKSPNAIWLFILFAIFQF